MVPPRAPSFWFARKPAAQALRRERGLASAREASLNGESLEQEQEKRVGYF
jgi:hypothetical protein